MSPRVRFPRVPIFLEGPMQRLVLLCAAGVIAIIGCTPSSPSDALHQGDGNRIKKTTSARTSPSVEAGHSPGQESPETKRHKGVFPAVDCVSISPDGKRGLSCSGDTLTLWSLPAGKAVRTFEAVPGDP